MSLQPTPLCDSVSNATRSNSIVKSCVQQIESRGPLSLPSPRGHPAAMAPQAFAAVNPTRAQLVPPIQVNPLQVNSTGTPLGVSIPVGNSPESVCMNLEDELTKMIDEDSSRKVNPSRRARSVSRTPPNPPVKVRAVTLSSNPAPGILHQCARVVASNPFQESRRARHDEISAQSRVRTKSKSGRTSSRPPKSRLVVTGNALPGQEKTLEFMFEQKPVSKLDSAENLPSNFWADMLGFSIGTNKNKADNIPNEVVNRILKASSFKLNWVLDPFARTGGIGIVAKKMGRRFIGFEINKDKLIFAMKRIDNEEK